MPFSVSLTVLVDGGVRYLVFCVVGVTTMAWRPGGAERLTMAAVCMYYLTIPLGE